MLSRVRQALGTRMSGVADRFRPGRHGDRHDLVVSRLEDLADRQRADLEDVVRRHGGHVEEVVRHEADRVIAAVQEVEARDRRNILAAGQREAVRSSARFARAVMPTVPVFRDPSETLAHALELAPAEGMALEFGVYTGGTLTVIAQARNGTDVYGFDSFRGLPEHWRTEVRAGAFRVEELPKVEGAELVVGMFSETLPGFLTEHPGPVAFLHIDADLYASARTVLDHIGPRLRPGTVILFDEYFNYAGWEEHEYRAWQEFVARSGIRFAYEGYTVDNEQVVVRVTDE